MQLREYRAGSMKEALLRVKEDLGDGAVILKSRTVSGVSGPPRVEVIAAVDPDHAYIVTVRGHGFRLENR